MGIFGEYCWGATSRSLRATPDGGIVDYARAVDACPAGILMARDVGRVLGTKGDAMQHRPQVARRGSFCPLPVLRTVWPGRRCQSGPELHYDLMLHHRDSFRLSFAVGVRVLRGRVPTVR